MINFIDGAKIEVSNIVAVIYAPPPRWGKRRWR